MIPSSYTRFHIFNNFPNIICAFSTRTNDESSGHNSDQNASLKTGNDSRIEAESRKLIFKELGILTEQIAFSDQIHSRNVSVAEKPGIYPGSDALATNKENIFLVIQTADCFPIFIFDPHKHAVAAIHAGWRGVKSGIIQSVISKLKSSFDLMTADLFVAIGPGLQKECFEVRSDVSKYFPDIYLAAHPDPDKRYLDLSGYIMHMLIDFGIPVDQIQNQGDCTMCQTDLYYSYRRDKEKSGRMIGLIGMRSV